MCKVCFPINTRDLQQCFVLWEDFFFFFFLTVQRTCVQDWTGLGRIFIIINCVKARGPDWQHSRSRRPHLFVKMKQISVVALHLDCSVRGGGSRTCSFVSCVCGLTAKASHSAAPGNPTNHRALCTIMRLGARGGEQWKQRSCGNLWLHTDCC